MTATTHGFDVETSAAAFDKILPQKAGTALWAPAFVMALAGFVGGIVLHIVKATAIADGDAVRAVTLGNLGTASMFFGFTMVFSAIAFAIARILGEFRVGGSGVQASLGGGVKVLQMPVVGKAFIGLMAMGMMIILAGVIGHVVVAIQVNSGTMPLLQAEQWDWWLEAARRFGVQVYLFSILLGLATIIYVVRFQTIRIRELAQIG